MPVKIHNFGGILGWNARKYVSHLASSAYLTLQFKRRAKLQREYINYFFNCKEVPKPNIVNVETINKCNSTCEFCSANRNTDKRPLAKIPDDIYRRIIDELADWGYQGHLTLYGNNEPWLDNRIVEFHKYAREKLPGVFIFMSTNGLLLNIEKLNQIAPYVNQLIINNYCLDMKLHKGVGEIYEHIKSNSEKYKDLDVLIQMRYLKEVLTNRAGSAPNKQATPRIYTETCLMPFTDMWITSHGVCGLCCCDNFEVTNLGDISKHSLREIWESEEYTDLRRKIAAGRDKYPFCKHCDFIDAGLRMDAVSDLLKGEEMHGARQSFFRK